MTKPAKVVKKWQVVNQSEEGPKGFNIDKGFRN